MLAVIETHPVQYHAPVYRAVQKQFGVSVTVIYGSDFSLAGYVDSEFGAAFSWDTDLLEGYNSKFLSRVQQGGAKNDHEVSTRGLSQVIAELNPKAILLLGYSPAFYRRASSIAVRSGKPLLFRGETTDHAKARSGLKSFLRDLVLRRLYRRCAKLLYVGERSVKHFERLGFPRESLIFSPYCVDASVFECDEPSREKFRFETRHKIGATESDIVLLFSGKLSHRKGPDLIIDAVGQLGAELRDRVVILFVGDGELRVSLERRCIVAGSSELGARSSRRPRAFFSGFKNQRQLSPYFHASDLLILPSRYGETWGLVVNEALHHGVPAIVSEAVGCAPDLIDKGRTGEIFATDSATGLAAAIERVFAQRDNPEVRSACRAKAANYSVSRAAEGIARAYHEVVRQ